MIAFLTGVVAEKGVGHCVIDVGGVGYRVAMSTTSICALPAEGDEATVLTHMHIRDDEMSLFGFENAAEKELFAKLITVSGVGPKVALAALSSYTPTVIAEAIAREDVVLVSSVSGIGKKTAQRIILDLKDKLGVPDLTGVPEGMTVDAMAEASDALLAMGFSSAEVATAMRGYDDASEDTQALVKHALKRLGGGG